MKSFRSFSLSKLKSHVFKQQNFRIFFPVFIHPSSFRNCRQQNEKRKTHFIALQNQINPHFLFNCLTNLYVSIDENESVHFFCKKVISYVPAYARTKGGSAVRSRKWAKSNWKLFFSSKSSFWRKTFVSNQVTENLKEFKIPVGTLFVMAFSAITNNIIVQKHPWHALIKSNENFLYVINNYQLKKDVISMGVGQQSIIKDMLCSLIDYLSSKWVKSIIMLKSLH